MGHTGEDGVREFSTIIGDGKCLEVTIWNSTIWACYLQGPRCVQDVISVLSFKVLLLPCWWDAVGSYLVYINQYGETGFVIHHSAYSQNLWMTGSEDCTPEEMAKRIQSGWLREEARDRCAEGCQEPPCFVRSVPVLLYFLNNVHVWLW